MPGLTEWTFAADVAKWMTIWLNRRKSMLFVEAKVDRKVQIVLSEEICCFSTATGKKL